MISQNNYTMKTVRGEILGVDRITVYRSCFKCHKNLESFNENHTYIECTSCKFAQKPKACPHQCVVYATFLYDKEKLTLTFFTNVVLLVLKQMQLPQDNLTEQNLKSVFFRLPEGVELTFNKKNKVVSNILIH